MKLYSGCNLIRLFSEKNNMKTKNPIWRKKKTIAPELRYEISRIFVKSLPIYRYLFATNSSLS